MTDDPMDPALRELIASGRERLGPDAATIARLRARIDHAVAANAPVSTKAVAAKLVVIVALGVVGTGLYLYERGSEPGEVPPSVVAAADEAIGSPHVTLTSRDSLPTLAPDRALEAAPESRARARIEPARSAAGAMAVAARRTEEPVSHEPDHGVSLAREIELIDQATRTMRQGDSEAALATLGDYERETAGRGQLAQDAAALGVEILCRRNDVRATEALASFARAWPQSAQRHRLRTVCRAQTKEN